MRATDIIAWAIDGALYCADHADPTREEQDDGYATPVFAADEGWQDHCCDTCCAEAVETGEQPMTLGEGLGL